MAINERRDLSHRLDGISQDIRYALRTLGKNPAFTAVAILTLALGIGANAAIFSVVNGVLLKPLPFPHPEQLLRVWQDESSNGAMIPGPVSAVNLDDWRARRRVLADIAGYFYREGQSGTDLTDMGEPQRLDATFVSPGFWTTLGVKPQAGRVPRDDEMVRGSNDRLVVLSYAFWQRQFGGASSVIGRRLTLGGNSYEVVGVMPLSSAFACATVTPGFTRATMSRTRTGRMRGIDPSGIVE